MSASNTIALFAREDTEETRSSFAQKVEEIRFRAGTISTVELQQRLKSFLDQIGDVLQQLPQGLGDFELDAICISVEVSATGKVSLLGSGIETVGKGGLTFTLKRRAS